MMSEPMSLDRARRLAQDVLVARRKYGAQSTTTAFPLAQVLEALTVLEQQGNWDAPSQADLVKLKRQLTAAEARAAKCAKKHEARVE